MMKDLIARQLYQPAVVLPLLLLTRLMVTLDFNLAQVMFVMVLKGSQHAYQFALRHTVARQRGHVAVKRVPCSNCC
jgi:Arc/MetJ family transcription regulator